jgi:adenylylsulfate kinase
VSGPGGVICFTGRPQAGKSTLARAVVERLRAAGVMALVLDGDAVRRALVPAPGYGEAEREAFYATLANLAELLAAQGAWVAVAATAHLRRYRDQLRARAPRYLEVFVNAAREECEARDVKGLYARARRGEILGFTGVDDPYEAPLRPELTVDTSMTPLGDAVEQVLTLVR